MKKTLQTFICTLFIGVLFFAGAKLPAEAADTCKIHFYESDGATKYLDGTKDFDVDYGTSIKNLDKSKLCFLKDGHPVDHFVLINCLGQSLGNVYAEQLFLCSYIITTDISLNIVWSKDYVHCPIIYVLNGGTNPAKQPTYYTYDSSVTFLTPTRSKYIFEGWYADAAFTQKFEGIPAHILLIYGDDGTLPTFTVYAKWSEAAPKAPSIKSVKNSSKGKIKITLKAPGTKYDGFEIAYSNKSSFPKKNTTTLDIEKNKTKSVTDAFLNGKTYYVRARSYRSDSGSNRIYSSWSSKTKVKISKGLKVVSPSSSCATLKSVKVSGTKYLAVEATLKNFVKSYDSNYYLVKVNPNTGAYYSKVAELPKSTSLKFKVPLTDKKGNSLIEGKYAIAVKSSSKKYKLISKSSFVSNPEAAATFKAAYPKTTSKKGRQGMFDTHSGDQHYFNNLVIGSIISSKAEGGEAFKYNGKTYYFKADWVDSEIARVNKAGGTVTMQIMLRYDNSIKKLIKESGRVKGKNYYAFNVENDSSRNQIEATFMWLAKHWSQTDLHVDNWILGNEVNTYLNPIGWYWAGNISHDAFIKNYAETFRILYTAVVSNYKNARVFTCVDHTWSNRDSDWGVREFLDAFDSALNKLNKNYKWNLAYHAYSAVLTNADFWNDNKSSIYSTSNNINTDFVSPLNIEVMTDYVKKKFGKNTHIILSEQAFSSDSGTNSQLNRPSSEKVQAAAVAYLYYKVMFNKNIDSVIYAHPVDNLGPGMNFSMAGKMAESVYKYMDTPSYASYTVSLLPTIGTTSWSNIVPGFSDAELKKMPERK